MTPCCRHASRIRPRLGSRRSQRRVRHRVPAGRRRCGPPRPRPPVLSGPTGAPRAEPRRGPKRAAGRTRATVRLPPHPPTARSTTRVPPSTYCTRSSTVSNQGVHTYADLRAYLPDVTPAQRRKRVLADGLPRRPGSTCSAVPGEVLYVGTAVDLRRRVSQYFNGTDPRVRMKEMVGLASAVDHVECAHPWRPGCVNCGCWPRMPRPTTADRGSPHRWWWVVLHRRSVPAIVSGPQSHDTTGRRPVPVPRRRRGHRRPARPVHRGEDLHQAAGALGAARSGPAEVELSPCPGARDVTAGAVRPRRRGAPALIDGLDNGALATPSNRSPSSPSNVYSRTPRGLRHRIAVAIEALWRGQRLRA